MLAYLRIFSDFIVARQPQALMSCINKKNGTSDPTITLNRRRDDFHLFVATTVITSLCTGAGVLPGFLIYLKWFVPLKPSALA